MGAFRNKLICLKLILIVASTNADASTIDTLGTLHKHGLYSVSAFTPEFCFITVKLRQQESGKTHNWEHYYINQKINTAYRYSQIFGWQKNKHWGFETGIELCRKVMMVDFKGNDNIPEVRLTNKSNLIVYYRTVFNAFTIPLRAVFTAGQHKFKFFSYVGFNETICFGIYQEALGYDSKLLVTNQLITQNLNFKKLFASTDWGVGVKYNISSRAQIRVNASVQRSYATVKTTNKKILLWSNGLSIGYVYSL